MGISCLPETFTRLVKVQEENYEVDKFLNECTERYGYSPGDVAAVLEIRKAIEATSHFGICKAELSKRFCSYEEVEAERSRSLEQYIQVGLQPAAFHALMLAFLVFPLNRTSFQAVRSNFKLNTFMLGRRSHTTPDSNLASKLGSPKIKDGNELFQKSRGADINFGSKVLVPSYIFNLL